MSRARDAKRQRRLLARQQEADMVQQATAQVETTARWLAAWRTVLQESRKRQWLASPHPFWPKRHTRMTGK